MGVTPLPDTAVPAPAGSHPTAFKMTASMSAVGVTYWMPNWRNPITGTVGAEEQDGLQRSLVPSTMGTVTIESLRLMLLTCNPVLGFDCPPLMRTGNPIVPVAAKQSELASTGQVGAVLHVQSGGKGGGGGGDGGGNGRGG
jgi:hypothetical protein